LIAQKRFVSPKSARARPTKSWQTHKFFRDRRVKFTNLAAVMKKLHDEC
jgi:hypothetical protein